MGSELKLLRCPFCDKIPLMVDKVSIRCSNKTCTLGEQDIYMTIDQWQSRPSQFMPLMASNIAKELYGKSELEIQEILISTFNRPRVTAEEIEKIISDCIKKEINEGYKEGGIYPKVVAIAIAKHVNGEG